MPSFGLVLSLLVTLFFWGLVFIKKEPIALAGAIPFTIISIILIYMEQPLPVG